MGIFLFVLATAAFPVNAFSSDAQNAEIIEIHYSVKISGGDYVKNSVLYSFQNFFDSSGNKVLDIRFDSAGNEVKRYAYVYNESGLRTEQNQFTPEGLLVRKIVYTYDDAGRLAEDNSYDSLGNHEKKYTYRYDQTGRLIEDRSFSPSGDLIKKYIHYYNEEGSKTKSEIFDSSESLVVTIEYSYSSTGEQSVWTEECIFDSEGNLYKTFVNEFKYDEDGRWIEKVILVNGEPVEIIERSFSLE